MTQKRIDNECAALLEDSAALYASAASAGASEIEIARAFTSSLFQKYAGSPPPNVDSSRYKLGAPSSQFEVRLYRPREHSTAPKSPLIIFFHGGGWSVGDAACYEPFLMHVCDQAQVKVLSVDYRLAPEASFPAAHNDCYCATLWAIASSTELNIDPEQIILMGDSAGGNIAFTLSNRLSEDNQPRPLALYLLYPFLNIRNEHETYPSRMQYGDGEYLISRDGLELACQWYFGDRAPPEHLDMFANSPNDFRDLSETVIITAGFDPLLDEAHAFAQKLSAAGNIVREMEVLGAIHGFLPFGELKVAKETRAWIADDIRRCITRKIGGEQ
jgi:acetyl esterase